MALYDTPTSENFNYVKYNAKAGRWYVKKDGSESEVQNPVFVADFKNIRKAWMHFQEGQAPNVVYFGSVTDNVPKPSENHKLGLSVNLFSAKQFGGVVKMETNSINTCKAISDLYALYEAAPESGQGKLPVVKVTGATPVKGNYGTNYSPVFVIDKWVDTPDELSASGYEPETVVADDSDSEF